MAGMMNDVPSIVELSPPPPAKRVWGGWPTAGFGAVVIVVFFIVQSVVIVIGLFAGGFPDFSRLSPGMGYNEILDSMTEIFNNLGLYQSIATIVSGIAGIALIFVFIKLRERANIGEYLGLNKISLRGILLALAVVIVFYAATIGVNTLAGSTDNEKIMYDLYASSVWPVLFWIAVVVFAPAFEEILFRGFLFEGFRQSRIGAFGAVIITAVVWAMLHAMQYSMINVVWILVLGIVMGIVRVQTKSLWNTIAMHMLVNLVGMFEIALNVYKFIK
jgi:uncharacterized protein